MGYRKKGLGEIPDEQRHEKPSATDAVPTSRRDRFSRLTMLLANATRIDLVLSCEMLVY
jgi:hypothetical protein